MHTEKRQQGLLFVISGPTAVGKDSVIQGIKERGENVHVVVTTTTRPPRPGEVDGRDYHFVSEERFRELDARGEMLESALVHKLYWYGSPKDEVRRVLAAGRDVVVRVDVQGAAAIRKKTRGAVSIFLQPGSLAELEERLRRRKTESADEIEKRLASIPVEMAEMPLFEYTVVNADGRLAEAVDNVIAIIHAERCRTKRRRIRL